MNIEDATKLLNKAMAVILSCETKTQLEVAVGYSSLAYRIIRNETLFTNNMQIISLMERSIGYAQCQITNGIKSEPGLILSITNS